jgi:hypothetical protein
MENQLGKPRSYGADDILVCPNCFKPIRLTRRGPDGDFDFRYERQIFTCWACDRQIERRVDVDGVTSNTS